MWPFDVDRVRGTSMYLRIQDCDRVAIARHAQVRDVTNGRKTAEVLHDFRLPAEVDNEADVPATLLPVEQLRLTGQKAQESATIERRRDSSLYRMGSVNWGVLVCGLEPEAPIKKTDKSNGLET